MSGTDTYKAVLSALYREMSVGQSETPDSGNIRGSYCDSSFRFIGDKMQSEIDRRRARMARRRREAQLRRRIYLTCGILALCLVIGIGLAVFLNRRTVETASGVSREGLEKLLQTAQAVDISAYPSDWTDELENSIQTVSKMLENPEMTDVEIDTAYRELLGSLQAFSQRNTESQTAG